MCAYLISNYHDEARVTSLKSKFPFFKLVIILSHVTGECIQV